MIHLVAIQTSPGVWTITTSDMVGKGAYSMSKTQPYGADRCPNCGEYGSHYCGPSFGDEGFFICKKKPIEETSRNRINRIKDELKKEIERPDKLIKKMRESGREGGDNVTKRTSKE